MTPKPKLLFDNKIFTLIEGVEFAGYPIYGNKDERVVLNNGKIIHRAERTDEDMKFLRRKSHRRGGDERRGKSSSNLSNFNRADLQEREGGSKTRLLQK